MRMHRGSSKDGEGGALPPETLPLSASRPSLLVVDVEVARAGHDGDRRREEVEAGTTVRELLRRMGRAPEGCAVLLDDVSVPLDRPIDRPLSLRVVPTFSGG